ncbi:MAG TPA: preprotein translocase subunit SecG [Rubricoccaceae bacterium]|nr:preprotein translocase subunit SecG [Rubricoccaceae bacterium]
MFTFLVILALLDAILLSVVVLLQSGKGGGLAGIAAGGQATQILGARQAPDFLEKATWVLGTALLVICFVAPFTLGGDAERSILRESVQDAPVEAPGVLPTTPGAPGPEVPGQTPGAPQEAPPTADE